MIPHTLRIPLRRLLMSLCRCQQIMEYHYKPVDAEVDDIVFSEYSFGDRVLRLAHFVVLPNNIRLEVSHVEGIYAYSVMRIEPDGDRDYYLLQETLQDVANIINSVLRESMDRCHEEV